MIVPHGFMIHASSFAYIIEKKDARLQKQKNKKQTFSKNKEMPEDLLHEKHIIY